LSEILLLTLHTGEAERLPLRSEPILASAPADLRNALDDILVVIPERPRCQLTAVETPSGHGLVAAVFLGRFTTAIIVAADRDGESGQFWPDVIDTAVSNEFAALANDPPEPPWCALVYLKPDVLSRLGIPADWLRDYCVSIALAWFARRRSGQTEMPDRSAVASAFRECLWSRTLKAMGWRAQNAYDEAQREDWRRFMAAQPLRRRLAIRARQGLWLAAITAFMAAALAVSVGAALS